MKNKSRGIAKNSAISMYNSKKSSGKTYLPMSFPEALSWDGWPGFDIPLADDETGDSNLVSSVDWRA